MSRFAIASLLAAVCLAGCHKEPPPPQEDPLVQVSLPVEKEITDFLEFQGRTSSPFTVEIRSQVTGYLKSITFKEGNEVVGFNQAPLFIAGTLGMLAPATDPAALNVACSMQPFRATVGDPLYRIDPDIYLASVAKAEADIQSAKAGVITTKASYEIEVKSKEGSSELTRSGT